MLHWRCKILPKLRRPFFWCKLIAVSLVGHLFLLFALLFAYKGSYFSFSVTINRSAISNGAPVVFLPFKKTVAKTSVKNLVATKKAKPKPKQKPKKKTTVASKKKVTPKKKTIAKSKPKPKKKAVKTAQKKKPVAKVAEKKKHSKKKIEKVAAKEKSKPVVQKTIEAVSAQPVYVGQLEMAALQMQDEMQQEVSKVWQPPAGLPKDLECTVKIVVDWSGKTQEAIVEQPSGVLMYDISARTAASKLCLPKAVRGKTVNIIFKQ